MNNLPQNAFLILTTTSLISGCTSVLHTAGLTDCAPVYGNWCGENYPTTGYNPRAVDEWDRACRRHDKCYDSGRDNEYCDRRFIRELEILSYEQLAPQEMHNAYSWFRKDGNVGGWSNFGDEIWSLSASCKGGDGRPAEFYCVINQFNGCTLDPEFGPGRSGMRCNCGGFPGLIVER